MISNTDSILLVYSTEHIRVKVYSGWAPGEILIRMVAGLAEVIEREETLVAEA
jgi:hypothetical protein